MAASHSDRYILSQDPGFQNRVRASLLTLAAFVQTGEAWSRDHEDRLRLSVKILSLPATWSPLFSNVAATDPLVIGDATVGGTLVLTSVNVAAQAALVTDAHLDNAVQVQFGSFITPRSPTA
jgi:hypothetical protein